VVTISISAEALCAIAAPLPEGREADRRPDGKGGYSVTLPRAMLDRLKSLRGPVESYSNVILRVAGWRADSMADRYNEGKALDAVIRFIEARDHAPRGNDGRSPDDLNDPDEQRRVDYVCTVGQTLDAFEHTGIDSQPNQVAQHNQKLFEPIIKRFDHRADQEIWDLYVPVAASVGLTGDEVGEVQNK